MAAIPASEAARMFEEVARQWRAPANAFALTEHTKHLISLVTLLTVDQFAQLRAAICPAFIEETEADQRFTPLRDRLFRLHHRLEQEGLYVDADIVWQAHDALGTTTAALREAERFMAFFAGETDNHFTGPGTPQTCLATIREALAA
jgi:hypothetical protein